MSATTINLAYSTRPARLVAASERVRAATVLAAFFMLVWAFSLSRSIFDPMGYDQGLYQYMAERIIAGERLYVDVWDQNGPGIVAIHWLSTHLVGTSPIALRVFDAVWQALTLAALIGLAVRDGRRWSAGWLAASLYALSYYSMGYVHTAQREGFAVLPLLLMIHLLKGRGHLARVDYIAKQGVSRLDEPPILSRRFPQHGEWVAARLFITGVLALFVFAIKPPLGLAFGAVWLYTLAQAWSRRDRGLRALAPLTALTLGFIIAAAGTVALLVHLGSWDACWGILSRRDMPGYILGPKLIRAVLPSLAAGALLFAMVGRIVTRSRVPKAILQPVHACAMGWLVFALLITCRQWPGWQHVLVCFCGLWIPAIGSILLCSWQGLSEIRRLALLLLLAASGAFVLQGQFFLYHLPPMLALAAYLAAVEICDRSGALQNPISSRPAWITVCLASVAYLGIGQWWPTMSFTTAHPYVLANRSLADHYTSITKHKLNCPTYATTIRVADHIRELTHDHEPIASLFHEARIYYFARRPSVHKLICMQIAYEHMFADYMHAIRDRRPKVIVARIPQRLRQSRDLQSIEAAVFDEAESFFGPPGRTIRELYHVTELIDDVCLLAPNS